MISFSSFAEHLIAEDAANCWYAIVMWGPDFEFGQPERADFVTVPVTTWTEVMEARAVFDFYKQIVPGGSDIEFTDTLSSIDHMLHDTGVVCYGSANMSQPRGIHGYRVDAPFLQVIIDVDREGAEWLALRVSDAIDHLKSYPRYSQLHSIQYGQYWRRIKLK